MWDSFNGHMNHVIANFVPTKYNQSKQSNYKSSKFKRYPRFIAKLLAKNCAVDIVINLALMMLLKQHIINHSQMPVSVFSNIINIWKRKSLIEIMSVLFTNLLITNLAVKVALAQ